MRDRILAALDAIAWDKLDHAERLDLVRVYEVLLNRFGRPDEKTAARLIARFDAHYPAASLELNVELAQLLVFLEAPGRRGQDGRSAPAHQTQEEQVDYGRDLRVLKTGWTPELRKAYFQWLAKATAYKGGNSFRGLYEQHPARRTGESQRRGEGRVRGAAGRAGAGDAPTPVPNRSFVKNWTLDELVPLVESGLKGRDYDRGRAVICRDPLLFLSPLQRRRRRIGARSIGRGRPLQHARPAGSDRATEQGDQRPI